MATIHERYGMRSHLAWLLSHDFCPGFNRYLYWLREPIGWFVLALATSAIHSGDTEHVLFWLENWEDWSRRLEVGTLLRQGELRRTSGCKAI